MPSSTETNLIFMMHGRKWSEGRRGSWMDRQGKWDETGTGQVAQKPPTNF
jgi:hypothetical protein